MRILSNEYLANIPNSSTGTKGGPARFARDFSSYLSNHGHEWIGVIHDPKASVECECVFNTKEKRMYVVSMKKATYEVLYNQDTYIDPEVLFKSEIEYVVGILRKEKIDIVLLNGFASFCWIISAAARVCNIPVVMQYAGLWYKEIDIYADRFHPESRKLCFYMEQDAARHASYNIFLNEYSRDCFFERYPHLVNISSGIIPLPHAGWVFHDVVNQSREQRTIGVVARWDRIKNHAGVLSLAEAIKKANLPWKIQSVTSIPNTDIQKEFKERYKEIIEVLPNMNREEIQKFFQSCDMVILPSVFDVSPTVVMEAIACGVPTLISPGVGWVSEYKKSGMDSWIVDFSDGDSVIHRMQEIFARTQWSEVSVFAQLVREFHDSRRVFEQYISVFLKIKSKKRFLMYTISMTTKNITIIVILLAVLVGASMYARPRAPQAEIPAENSAPVAGKLNITAVCESALSYMSFPDGASADVFVAECVEGKRPEVIERYKAEMGLGDGATI